MNPIDKIVSFFNPVSGLKREYARQTIGALTNVSNNGYPIPGSRKKALKGWTARLASPAKDIDRKLTGIRAASRDLSMNSSTAASIFRRYKTNVPGAGLIVQPRIDSKFLGLTPEQADDWNNAAIREFDLWSDSLESDFTGVASFNELQGLIYMSSLINGDIFFVLTMHKSLNKNWPYETAIKVIDADLVRDPDEMSLRANTSTNAQIRNGVEYNEKGQLVAYWVANYYNNDDYSNYDVVVGEAQHSPTRRQAIWNYMLQLAQAGLQIPPAIFYELSELPLYIKKQIQAYNASVAATDQQQLDSKQSTEIWKTIIVF